MSWLFSRKYQDKFGILAKLYNIKGKGLGEKHLNAIVLQTCRMNIPNLSKMLALQKLTH